MVGRSWWAHFEFTRRPKSVSPGKGLEDAGRGIAGGGRLSVRSTVVAQIAVSLVLVVAAGLFLRTFASLKPLAARLRARATARRGIEFRGERRRNAVVPGVRSASASAIRLLTGGGWGKRPGRPGRWANVRQPQPLWLNATTPGWFETMGIRLRSGRDFEAGDRVASRRVAIVNEAFVRRFLPGEQPIGQHVRLGFDAHTRREMVRICWKVLTSEEEFRPYPARIA